MVVPEFKPLFEDAGQALPLATRIVIAGGDAFRDYWWAGLVGILALFFLVRRSLRDRKVRLAWDRRLLGIPLVGDLIIKTEVARFGRTLGTLLQNGVTLLNAMGIVQEVHFNTVVRDSVGSVTNQVREGQGLAGPLSDEGVFPNLAVHLIRVGEESGRLEEILLRIADIFEREVQRTMDRLLALLVPALTIGLGVIIAGIIASVLVAILSTSISWPYEKGNQTHVAVRPFLGGKPRPRPGRRFHAARTARGFNHPDASRDHRGATVF